MLEKTRKVMESPWGVATTALIYAVYVIAVNWTAGHEIAVKAGILHWLMSTFLSYSTVKVMNRTFHKGHPTILFATALTLVTGISYDYLMLFMLHWLIGTPRLFWTLIAGIIPTVFFCSSYALLLNRTAHKRAQIPNITHPTLSSENKKAVAPSILPEQE